MDDKHGRLRRLRKLGGPRDILLCVLLYFSRMAPSLKLAVENPRASPLWISWPIPLDVPTKIRPRQIDQVTKGQLPKDLSENLKRIEKLAKQLRSQIVP